VPHTREGEKDLFMVRVLVCATLGIYYIYVA